MNLSLYEIKKELADLFRELEVTTDQDLRAALLASINEKQVAESDKKEAWCCFLKNQGALVDAIDAEITRLKEKKAQAEKTIEEGESYLSSLVTEKWSNGIHEMGWRKCPPSAEPVNVAEIPVQYMREKISYEPDRALALKDFKAGVKEIRGFEYVTGKRKFYVK